MTLKKDSLKRKSFIQVGQQEGKENVWCSPKTLCTCMSCLENCLFNPLFLFKVHVLIHDQCLACALSLTQMQRLSIRGGPEVQAAGTEDENSLGFLTAHRVTLNSQSPKRGGLQQHLALRTGEHQYFHHCYLKAMVSSSWYQTQHSIEE